MNNTLFRDYLTLCKPKVVFLMLITSWVGMYLASEENFSWQLCLSASLGIGMAASSAAVINHLIDRHIDAQMSRTAIRPIASGRIQPKEALIFSGILGVISMCILLFQVNALVAILTFLTLLGYAFFYTVYLKRATPQNIVIGGICGAMPPLLGWTAFSGNISPESLLLTLIIFTWTPPHFWALAIYRREDYQKANIPMLPVTHGIAFTKLCILLYTVLLIIVSLLPYLTGMSHFLYLISALLLDVFYLYRSIILLRSKTAKEGLTAFKFSIAYLSLIFIAILVDHRFPLP